ncbi:Uncharacterised protein [Burkholderia pseudomallei]|nr:Uncharacterised protein [Burkholderia pseudomallei]CAJ3160112.1 Uncharacterised protein [Burkholderia pseudomallei]CAJ3166785.1 Uncharacterised protein [Burkholderia pseudomallei]VBC62566.1 Uncharacterised protein [Burkholderia pseudomallei]VBE28514.1 Uncharacterised protein [Burkholderia pseudomallei]
MRCALCEEGGIGISIFGAENACCPNRHGPNARLTNGCIRTGASQTAMSRTGMSRTARPERRDPNGETRMARPEWRDPNGETRMGRIPAGLGAVVLVMRAFSRRRARIVRAFGLLARCVARRRFRAVVDARAPRAPDRIVIRVIALLLAPQKKFVTARSRCRRNRCVVRLWKEAGRGSASAGTSTDETIRCLNGARRCSVGAKRENHSRAVQSAFQAAFSAMLKTAARPLK